MSEMKTVFNVGIISLGRAGYNGHAKELSAKPDKFRGIRGQKGCHIG